MRPARVLLLAALLAAGGGVAACQNDDAVRPSPLPPGYAPLGGTRDAPTSSGSASEERGEALDEVLAVVEGQVITRRRLAREAGGRAPGEDEAAFERTLRRRLLQRARLLLFVREAQRIGISLSEQRVDEVVAEELAQKAEEASETVGRTVTVAEYLREEGQTLAEFRARVKEELLYQAYILRLLRGIGGPTRSMVDLDVPPSEVRMIYWDNPGAFDEKRAVRFVVYQLLVQRHLGEEASFLDAEEKVQAEAEALAAGFRGGVDPAALAERYDLGEGQWRDSGEPVPEGDLVRLLGEENTDWLFDGARRVRDVRISPSGDGPLVLGILEIEPGRRIPYDEAYDKIVAAVKKVKIARVENERLIEILSTRSVVQPPIIADALLDQARDLLDELDRDPVLGSVRMR